MKYQICVSGAARGKSAEAGEQAAYETGKTIGEAGHILLTGATIGIPYAAARGIKSVNGHSIGLSPAATRYEHIKKYRLPADMYDVVLYTGLNYVGRDDLLINCCDAVISIGGRMGTTHEFAAAMETGKQVAILEGVGGTSALFDELLSAAGRSSRELITDSDPKALVAKIIAALDDKYSQLAKEEPNILIGQPQSDAITQDKELEEYR